MEFLVRIRVRWPADDDPSTLDDLIQAERARVGELVADGTLLRLWRVPGRWENVTLWRAPDATSLDVVLRSLPLYPWLDITVEPLADHPSDPNTVERSYTE